MYTRVRERDDRYIGSVTQIMTTPTTWNYGYRNLGKQQIVLDIADTRFHPGILSINPCDMRRFTGVATDGDLTWRGKIWGYPEIMSLRGQIAALQATPSYNLFSAIAPDANLGYNAQLKAVAKMKTSHLAFEGGVMTGELRETLGMLINPLRSARQLIGNWMYSAFRRGIPKGSPYPHTMRELRRLLRETPGGNRKLGKALADSYAEVRWGLLPLITDINNLKEALSKGVKTNISGLLRESGGSYREIDNTSFDTSELYGSFRCNMRTTIKSEAKTTATVYFNRYWSHGAWGGDIVDLIPTLYELTPYSFVLDWIVDIGSWLKAMRPAPELKYLGCSVSYKRTYTYKKMLLSGTIAGLPATVNQCSVEPCSYVGTEERLIRSSAMPLTWKPGLAPWSSSVLRKWDTVTLLAQRLQSIKR